MTFNRSIIFSLVLHTLLLGTGLAFARLGPGLLSIREEPMVVALVGNGGISMHADAPKKASNGSAAQSMQQKHPVQKAPDRKVSTVQDSRETAPLPQQAQETGPAQVPADLEAGPALVAESGAAASEQDTGQTGGQGSAESGSSGPGNAGAESGSVSSEQWAVIVSSIEQSKSYPRLARRLGIQGVVQVRFRLNATGEVDKVEIVRSSGYEILDDESVRTVYRAGPMPYVTGWIEVPLAYVLK